MEKGKIEKILFITLSNVGDIVLTTPAIRSLSENFPGKKIDIMVGPNGAELFEDHPAAGRVIVYNKHISIGDKLALVKELRGIKYDLVVDMRNSFFPFLLGARYRTNPMQNPPKSVKHKKEQHLWKLSSAGIKVLGDRFYLHIPDRENKYIDSLMTEFDSDKPIVAISPGAKSDIKKWPRERYAELTDRLMEELGVQIVMVGDKVDSPLVKDIIKSAKNHITDFSDKTSLCQLASLLKRCDLLVTNDSAPLHIAGAVDTKVLAIFGPTNPEAYGPIGKGDYVVRKKLQCSPCGKAQCRFNHECMRQIKTDEVFETAKKMLR